MAKKKSDIQFNVKVMMKLILQEKSLQSVYKKHGFTFDPMLFLILSREGKVNHKATQAMKKIFNDYILNGPYKTAYNEQYSLLEQEENNESTTEFSIKITGSGIKSNVISALENIIDSLKSSTVNSLTDGVEWESPTLMTTTGESSEY